MKKRNRNWKKCDDSFGYLMYVLNEKGFFSELHLPSLNKIRMNGQHLIMEKKIPKKFRRRILEICQIIQSSKKTNITLLERKEDKNHIYLIIHSKLGVIKNSKDLSLIDKKEIINLFFEYHQALNSNKNIRMNSNYSLFFNDKKFKSDISLLIKKVSSKRSHFDKKVLNYLKLISDLKINLDIQKLKMQIVHGDFIPRNIVYTSGEFYLIDLDTAHKGYIEIQFIRLLKELFGFGTKEFFYYLRRNKKNFINPLSGGEIFYLYLLHKVRDLSMLKSTYFTNKRKYLELRDYMSSQIDFISSLISKRKHFFKSFNLELPK